MSLNLGMDAPNHPQILQISQISMQNSSRFPLLLPFSLIGVSAKSVDSA
jgi:hypothetical protein